jgi:hypothetical protein
MTDEMTAERPQDLKQAQSLPDELERLKERVAFYESFDQLIHENIARSGDLLRQAMDLRETANRELEEVKAEADRVDSTRYRETLSDLLGEVTMLQSHVERLGRRVADAIEELEANLPSGERAAPLPRLPGGEAIKADFLSTPPEYVQFTTPEEQAAVTPSEPPSAAEVPRNEPSVAAPVTPAPQPEPDVLQSNALATAEAVAGVEQESAETEQPFAEAESAAHSMTILMHGVPRAATALSLQRYLAQLSQVETVEPREYAGGVLRLQIMVREPVSIDDLRGWQEGAGFEPVHAHQDLIEVRLPGASGF